MALSNTDLRNVYGLLDRVAVKGLQEVEALSALLGKIREEIKTLETPAPPVVE